MLPYNVVQMSNGIPVVIVQNGVQHVVVGAGYQPGQVPMSNVQVAMPQQIVQIPPILPKPQPKVTYTHDPYAAVGAATGSTGSPPVSPKCVCVGFSSSSTSSEFTDDKSVGSVCAVPSKKYKVEVSYRKYSRTETFYAGTFFEDGVVVVIPGDRGLDIGTVSGCASVRAGEGEGKQLALVREATVDEVSEWKCLDVYEEKARDAVQQILNRNNIPMTILGAEYQYDKKKLTLYYRTNKNEAVRFRPVLGELYASFKCRIWFTKI